MACACGRWLHEDCADDCVVDSEVSVLYVLIACKLFWFPNIKVVFFDRYLYILHLFNWHGNSYVYNVYYGAVHVYTVEWVAVFPSVR